MSNLPWRFLEKIIIMFKLAGESVRLILLF